MKKYYTLLIICILAFNAANAQINNGGFEDYVPLFEYIPQDKDPFFRANSGTSPWSVSHGTPQIYPTEDNNSANKYCAMMASFDGYRSPGSPKSRGDDSGEGLMYNYNFQKGKAYKLQFRYKAIVRVVPTGNNTNNNDRIDKVVIRLVNGVQSRTGLFNYEDCNLPNWSSTQTVFEGKNVKELVWKTETVIFYPTRDYSHLMFYCADKCAGSVENPNFASAAFFYIDDASLSCGQSNKNISGLIPEGYNNSSDILTISNANTNNNKTYNLSAANEIVFLPNSSIVENSNVTASIGNLNCAAEPSICSSPSSLYITNFVSPNGDGANDTWIVLDQSKSTFAYSSYKIYYDIYSKSLGSRVFCRNMYAKDMGMTGFSSGDIQWDALGVSDGIYYWYIRIYDCSAPRGSECWGNRSGNTCDGCFTIIQNEEEDLGYTSYKGWVQVKGGANSREGTFDEDDDNNLNDAASYLRVYPNPTKEVAQFELQSELANDNYSLYVIDFSGKVVYTQQDDFNRKISGTFDVSALSNGIYTIKIITTDKVWNDKLQIIK